MSKKTTTTTTNASEEDIQRFQRISDNDRGGSVSTPAQWIGNDNGVLILLDSRLLTVTLSRLYLVAVLF